MPWWHEPSCSQPSVIVMSGVVLKAACSECRHSFIEVTFTEDYHLKCVCVFFLKTGSCIAHRLNFAM